MTTRGERLIARLGARGMEQLAEDVDQVRVEKSEPRTQAEVWQRIENAAAISELTVDAYLDTAQGEALFSNYAAMEPVEKAEFPHTKADGDAAKAGAGKRLQPGEGRQYATEILGDLVKKLRKTKPSLSESDAWVQVLDTPEGARWYGIGEDAERESRRK